jgi:acyl dehydratase
MSGDGRGPQRMTGKTVVDLRVGDCAELRRRIEPAHVTGLIEAVGDYNPIHSDAAFAAATAFKEPIAPGVFTAGLISAVIGTQLPGPGAIYLSQTLKFLRPVRAGDTITARAEVLEVIPDRNRIRLATVCRNERGEEVLTGEAWVMPARTAVHYQPGPRAAAAALGALAVQPWAWTAQAMMLWGALGLSMLGAAGATSRDRR